MIREFTEHLRSMGKSENTIRTYCHDIEQFLAWCRDSFGEEPAQLYRENVLDGVFMKIQIQYASPCTVGKRMWRHSGSVFWRAATNGAIAWFVTRID